jgi:hypothetical protein
VLDHSLRVVFFLSKPYTSPIANHRVVPGKRRRKYGQPNLQAKWHRMRTALPSPTTDAFVPALSAYCAKPVP